MDNHKKTIAILKQFKEQYSTQYGISEMGIFGSTARDDRKENSDEDVEDVIVNRSTKRYW